MAKLSRKSTFIALCLIVFPILASAPANSANTEPLQSSSDTSKNKTDIQVDLTGGFKGQTYANKGLGFRLTLPKEWQVQDIETQKHFGQYAGQKVQDFSKNQAAVQASTERTKLLFLAIKPSEGMIKPNIVGMVEEIPLALNVKTSRQYLESMLSLSNASSPLSFSETIETVKINGVNFSVVSAKLKESSVITTPTLVQRYYVTLHKNYAIAFILTFSGDEPEKPYLEMLNSFKFL